MTMACNQSAESFIEFVRKCSAAKLDEALRKQANDNWTALQMAAHINLQKLL